jgi:ketosteroid isomerase-like protein
MNEDSKRLEVVREVTAAFDRHDVDGIMEHFTDDCVFDSPRGPNEYGQRFLGKSAVREAFAGRFAGIPDVRYTDDSHFLCGDDAVSQWTLSGTSTSGERIEVRGCDIGRQDRVQELVLEDPAVSPGPNDLRVRWRPCGRSLARAQRATNVRSASTGRPAPSDRSGR